jgi:drug/metabolite transporter (DMT)-like permease
VNLGALLAFATYFAFALGDIAIKALGSSGMSTFEITFWVALFTAIAMLPLRPPGERWRDVFRVNHPRLLLVRSISGLCAGVFGIAALITIPFAEAYALIFMAPFLVTLLSLLVLRERISWIGIAATVIGFAGVVMVIRPGLRALELGHLFAAIAAFFVALSTILVRRIASTEKRTSLLLMPQIVTAAAAGAIMTTHWVTPTALDLGLMALSGVFVAIAQFCLVLAARRVPATTIGQAQFSQMIWAIIAGALIFEEYPDLWSLAGIAVIAIAGLLTLRDRRAATPLPPDPSRG